MELTNSAADARASGKRHAIGGIYRGPLINHFFQSDFFLTAVLIKHTTPSGAIH